MQYTVQKTLDTALEDNAKKGPTGSPGTSLPTRKSLNWR